MTKDNGRAKNEVADSYPLPITNVAATYPYLSDVHEDIINRAWFWDFSLLYNDIFNFSQDESSVLFLSELENQYVVCQIL